MRAHRRKLLAGLTATAILLYLAGCALTPARVDTVDRITSAMTNAAATIHTVAVQVPAPYGTVLEGAGLLIGTAGAAWAAFVHGKVTNKTNGTPPVPPPKA